MLKNAPIRHFKLFCWSIRGKSDVVFSTSSLPLPFALACAASVKRMAKASSALMTAPPSSPTWFSWWSSTSSTEECCLANSNTRAPSWPYDTFGSHDPAPQHLTWLCLKWKESPRWSFLFVFIFVRSWWIDWRCCCCYTCFYIVVSLLETADIFFFLGGGGFRFICMEVRGVWCTTSLQRLAVLREDERNEHCHLCRCCCRIFHIILTNSHQKSVDPRGFTTQLKCEHRSPSTGQSAGELKLSCGLLCSLRTNESRSFLSNVLRMN